MDLKEKLGMAIIMITHDLGIVARMCEKIAVMYAGKIVEYGTTDEIFYEPKHEYTKGLLRSIPRLDSKDHERLVPIEGTPVDMLNPPKGCPFAPRCGACMKVCLREMPPRTDFSDTHYTQCWLCQKAEFEAATGRECTMSEKLVEVQHLQQYFPAGGMGKKQKVRSGRGRRFIRHQQGRDIGAGGRIRLRKDHHGRTLLRLYEPTKGRISMTAKRCLTAEMCRCTTRTEPRCWTKAASRNSAKRRP